MKLLKIGLIVLFSLFSLTGLAAGTDNISVGTAMSHCFGTTSYVAWLLAVIAVIAFGGYKLKKDADKNGMTVGKGILIGVMVAAFLMALLMRPCEIAANTTKEQAERGVYIGY